MSNVNNLLKLSHLRAGLGRLAGVVAEALGEMEAVKADKPSILSVAIPATGWSIAGLTVYPYCYYYDLGVSGVTANDIATVMIAPSSVDTAIDCGLCPTNETLANTIRFWSVEPPAQAITIEFEIAKGSE